MLVVLPRNFFYYSGVPMFYLLGAGLVIFTYKAIKAIRDRDFKQLPFYIVCALLADLFSVMVG